MYEILCSLGALLFQGLAAGLIVAGFTQFFEWYESRTRYEAASMFIDMEIYEHLIILGESINKNKLLSPDSPTGFSKSAWIDFRSDLVGHISVEDLRKITGYYHSINQIWSLSLLHASYQQYEKVITQAYADATTIRDLLSRRASNPDTQHWLLRLFLCLTGLKSRT